jgi:8-oxo-dGTP pyrophosphatase MutT (NUDIX family)
MSTCNNNFHDTPAVETQQLPAKKAKPRKRRRKDSPPPDNGGALIMAHDGTFLFLLEPKKHKDHWTQPGGKSNPGESSLQAARRETLEETGIDLSKIEPVGNYTHDHSKFTTYLLQTRCTTRAHRVEISMDASARSQYQTTAYSGC